MQKVLSTISILLLISCTPEAPQDTSDQTFQSFVDNFDPSNFGGSTNDLSAESFGLQIDQIRGQVSELRKMDTSQLTFENKIDWRFAHSILRGKEIRMSQHQGWKKDPRTYMPFRNLANIIGRPDEMSEKITNIEGPLGLVPTQLANGQKQLEVYIPRFQELSLFMAENAIGFFNNELPEFVEQSEGTDNLKLLVTNAQEALNKYISFLKDELPSKPEGSPSMGKEIYNSILKEEFLLDYTDETLWEFGNKKFNETVSELEVIAKEIDPSKTWQELAVEIKNDYPNKDKMIEAHQLWVDSAKSHILSKNLIPIPWNEQVQVVPRAEYLRKTSYYGNFSRARGKDVDGIFTAQWMINPYEEQWDNKTKQEYLVEHDWGVIIVTAPHEAYAGHHVQGLYQIHNPRKIRKENGISIFSEGWGLYNEQLMRETGFFPNKRIELRQLQLRLWRNARVVYDCGMHSGRLGYEEAISIMTEKVGFLRWAAQLEIDSSTRHPGYVLGYFLGMSEILKMREFYKEKMGDQFTLSDFHEKLLQIGNMPPKLMQKSLLR